MKLHIALKHHWTALKKSLIFDFYMDCIDFNLQTFPCKVNHVSFLTLQPSDDVFKTLKVAEFSYFSLSFYSMFNIPPVTHFMSHWLTEVSEVFNCDLLYNDPEPELSNSLTLCIWQGKFKISTFCRKKSTQRCFNAWKNICTVHLMAILMLEILD